MTEALNADLLLRKIALWGHSRGIISNSNAARQALKLTSEVGELCDAIAKNRTAEIIDGIGDCVVVLVMIAELQKLDFTACIEAAYEEIKDRKGHLTPEGIFIKENDK